MQMIWNYSDHSGKRQKNKSKQNHKIGGSSPKKVSDWYFSDNKKVFFISVYYSKRFSLYLAVCFIFHKFFLMIFVMILE